MNVAVRQCGSSGRAMTLCGLCSLDRCAHHRGTLLTCPWSGRLLQERHGRPSEVNRSIPAAHSFPKMESTWTADSRH